MKTNWQAYWSSNRKGVIFNDPVLGLFSPVDFSPLIFVITYSFSSLGVAIGLHKPELFVKLIQVYTILTLLRIITLYSFALEPPSEIIPLRDVLLQSTFYSGRENLKDLFFSGHVSILFAFAFVLTNKKLKWLFILAAILVGVLIMIQHVHYSIDVIAAPVFAYFAYALQKKIKFQ